MIEESYDKVSAKIDELWNLIKTCVHNVIAFFRDLCWTLLGALVNDEDVTL